MYFWNDFTGFIHLNISISIWTVSHSFIYKHSVLIWFIRNDGKFGFPLVKLYYSARKFLLVLIANTYLRSSYQKKVTKDDAKSTGFYTAKFLQLVTKLRNCTFVNKHAYSLFKQVDINDIMLKKYVCNHTYDWI